MIAAVMEAQQLTDIDVTTFRLYLEMMISSAKKGVNFVQSFISRMPDWVGITFGISFALVFLFLLFKAIIE